MSVRVFGVDESELPGWGPYREWFREQWAAGGAGAWLVALGHLLAGLILFGVVLSLPLGAGGGILALAYVALLAVVLYAATAPPAEPYTAWLHEKWLQNDASKLFIVVGHAIVGFFVLAVLLGLPFNGFAGALQSMLFFTAVYAMAVLALNLHWGYAGIFNIGVAGFMAVAYYVTAIASSPVDPGTTGVPGLGLPLSVGILLGILAAAVVGFIAALPALRLKADYFAIVTVALSEIIRITLRSRSLQTFELPFLGTIGTGGAAGKGFPSNPLRLLFYDGYGASAQPALLGDLLFPLFSGLSIVVIPDGYQVNLGVTTLPIDFTLDLGMQPSVIFGLFYVFVLAAFVGLFFWLLRRVGNSPFGRVLKAIREDEEVAQSLGKNTPKFKLISFAFGCGLMGLAGILWIGSQGYTNPNGFKPILTFYIWVALIIGGAGSNVGSVLGASLFASALWVGPVYLKNVVESFVNLPSPPNNVLDALAPLVGGQVVPLFAFLLNNIANLRLVFIGVLLIWLMQRRPEGLLGHRKEEAAAIPLSKPTRGGETNE
jgi:ABC-type branched-subunit amino acid transport system permease subunit